jgi:predicted helicase
VYKLPRFFPNSKSENLVICISGPGTNSNSDFSTFIVDCISDLHLLGTSFCFPLYRYSAEEREDNMLNFDEGDITNSKTYNLTDAFVIEVSKKINHKVNHETVFFYIYGLLHSSEFIKQYNSNLTKEIARIPISKNFKEISKIGKELVNLHLNYDKLEPMKIFEDTYKNLLSKKISVEKISFYKKDLTKLFINDSFIIDGIPSEIHDYKVNGRSPLAWVVERFNFTQDKSTLIINDPRNYSEDKKYIINLIFSVMTLSIETNRLIKELPLLDIID